MPGSYLPPGRCLPGVRHEDRLQKPGHAGVSSGHVLWKGIQHQDVEALPVCCPVCTRRAL